MKLLFVSAYFTYPGVTHGGGTDLLEMIKALSRRHEVHFVSFADPWEVGHADAMREFCRTVRVVVPANRWPDKMRSAARTVVRNPLRWPFVLGRRSHRELRQNIVEIVRREKIDIVQFEWTEAAQFVDALDSTDVLAVLDEVDVAFKPLLHQAKLVAGKSAHEQAVRRYERALQNEVDLCRRFDLVFTRSERDADLLRRHLQDSVDGERGRRNSITSGHSASGDSTSGHSTIGHSAGTRPAVAVLRPWTRAREYADVRPEGRQPGTLLFVGVMDRLPNVDAVLHFHRIILPLIRERLPARLRFSDASGRGRDVRFLIAGAEPAKQVRELEKDPSVTVTGFVPDLRQFYTACDVFVAPMRIGGGVSNKLIDAMAAGRPVVATSVANEGVGAQPGEEILIGDLPDVFAGHVLSLLGDEALWNRVATAGRAHVRRVFDWDKTVTELEEHYQRLLESGPAAARRAEANRGRT